MVKAKFSPAIATVKMKNILCFALRMITPQIIPSFISFLRCFFPTTADGHTLHFCVCIAVMGIECPMIEAKIHFAEFAFEGEEVLHITTFCFAMLAKV
jgi:hypothetical protein